MHSEGLFEEFGVKETFSANDDHRWLLLMYPCCILMQPPVKIDTLTQFTVKSEACEVEI